MEFHGIPWNSITTSWNSVELHGIPWNSMDTPWNSMAFHGTPWILHGTPWHSMELHGYSMHTPWKFHLIPWNSIDFHGMPRISIDFHGFPWISMEFQGGISHGLLFAPFLSSRLTSPRSLRMLLISSFCIVLFILKYVLESILALFRPPDFLKRIQTRQFACKLSSTRSRSTELDFDPPAEKAPS